MASSICGPAAPKALGKEDMENSFLLLECHVLEVTHIISTHSSVPVLYWLITNQSQFSGLQQWQYLFCSWICNLNMARWGQLVSAPFGVSWDDLKVEGWSHQPVYSLYPRLVSAGISVSAGASAVAVARTSTHGLSVARLPHSTIWIPRASVLRGLDRSHITFYDVAWWASYPHSDEGERT